MEAKSTKKTLNKSYYEPQFFYGEAYQAHYFPH